MYSKQASTGGVDRDGAEVPPGGWRSLLQRKDVRGMLGMVGILVVGVIFGLATPRHTKDPKPWGTISAIIGWTYFFAWSISFYPQAYLNWKRKSVVGLSFDFEAYNIIGFMCYAFFNCAFFFSSSIQEDYKRHHDGHANLVRVDDVAFALHAVVLTLFTIFQIFIYERGSQKISRVCAVLCTIMLVSIAVYAVLVGSGVKGQLWDWLPFLYFLSYIKLFVSTVKYMPQVYLNYARKSTIGWNIWNVLLDFTGGFLSVAQLMIDSGTTHDWGGVTGDPVKFGLGSLSMVFDVIFMFQHYCLYSDSNDEDQEEKKALLADVA